MKKITVLIIIFSSLLFGCNNEILDMKPLDIISDAAVWDDEALIDAYLISLYDRAETRGIFIPEYKWEPWPYANSPEEEVYVSDEARHSYSWSPSLNIYNRGLIDSRGTLLDYWNYGLIRNLNEFILKIEDSNLPIESRNERQGQARFLRAFTYFELVKRFGGVPLITLPMSVDAGDALFVSRNKESELYDFIISECTEISSVLPESYSNDKVGKANKFAALALKSRAALYAGSIAKYGEVKLEGVAGIPSGEAQKYFQASYEASKEIIESGKYSLFNELDDKSENYRQLFLTENNSEIIFDRKSVTLDKGHNFDFYNLPHGMKSGASWGSAVNPTLEMVDAYEMKDGSSGSIDWSNAQTASLLKLFENKDPRFHATIFYNGSYFKSDSCQFWYGTYAYNEEGDRTLYSERGKLINGIPQVGWGVASNDGTKTGFCLKKFANDNITVIGWNESNTPWLEFRLGEILLNHAEAAYEINKPDEALSVINQIRERAGVVARAAIDMEKIRYERRIELAFEAHRYWDLRRWRIAVDVLNNDFHQLRPLMDLTINKYVFDVVNGDGYTRVFNSKLYYFPITSEKIDKNPNLVQNPGY